MPPSSDHIGLPENTMQRMPTREEFSAYGQQAIVRCGHRGPSGDLAAGRYRPTLPTRELAKRIESRYPTLLSLFSMIWNRQRLRQEITVESARHTPNERQLQRSNLPIGWHIHPHATPSQSTINYSMQFSSYAIFCPALHILATLRPSTLRRANDRRRYSNK